MEHAFWGRHRVIPALRNVSLLISIGGLLLGLSVAPGCGKRWCGAGQKETRAENTAETGSAGVPVTAPVPHAGTTGVSTDNAAAAPSPVSVPRVIPIGKKPPPNVIPSTEEPR
jgi:hypothetical protein